MTTLAIAVPAAAAGPDQVRDWADEHDVGGDEQHQRLPLGGELQLRLQHRHLAHLQVTADSKYYRKYNE